MNRKRLIIYSLLALPLVIFAVFYITLDPIARGTFYREFKANTLAQFGYEPEPEWPAEEEASGNVNTEATNQGGAGGGGFDPAAIFARRDADDDGKLTGEEISERMQENLAQIDTDQDGAVTLEEFTQSMEQMRGRGGRGGGRPDGNSREGRPDRPARPE